MPFEKVEVEEGSNSDKACDQNFDAMTYLTMVFTTEVDMMMTMRAQSDEWPSR